MVGNWGLKSERGAWILFKEKGKFLLPIHAEYQCLPEIKPKEGVTVEGAR